MQKTLPHGAKGGFYCRRRREGRRWAFTHTEVRRNKLKKKKKKKKIKEYNHHVLQRSGGERGEKNPPRLSSADAEPLFANVLGKNYRRTEEEHPERNLKCISMRRRERELAHTTSRGNLP